MPRQCRASVAEGECQAPSLYDVQAEGDPYSHAYPCATHLSSTITWFGIAVVRRLPRDEGRQSELFSS